MKNINLRHELSGKEWMDAYTSLKSTFGTRFLGFEFATANVSDDFTDSESQRLLDIVDRRDMLDSWEPSKLRNLTIQQINDRIATVQNQIDAVTNVATAKTTLNSMYADMQKMARIIIWLLKREMNEL